MRIYLDVCCLNRPFDDQTQERIHLEAEAVVLILLRVHAGALRWVSSEVVDHEIGLTPDGARRRRVAMLAQSAGEQVVVEDVDAQRAAELEAAGVRPFDALHVACAERAGVDVLLTTDDKLLRAAARLGDRIRVAVKNPLAWILEEVDQ
jgi:predicted nucleic acid-binding protein